MKRTRRIEITSYSRSLTVIHKGDEAADNAAVFSATEVSAEVRRAIVSALEELDEDESMANESAAVQKSRRQPFNGLRIWLREVVLRRRQRVVASPSPGLQKKSL